MLASRASLTPAEIALLVAGVSLLTAVVTSAFNSLLSRRGQSADRRRDAFADAVATLFALAEYPYRIRRRTSDDPASLGKLADLGHDLQVRLRSHQTWIQTESRSLGEEYSKLVAEILEATGPAAKDAWASPPVTEASMMNLNGWGPRDFTADIEKLQAAVAVRFGWRAILRSARRH